MPQFQPYPIVNPDRYRDRNVGQEVQQGLNQGLETLIQAQQARKQREQQDLANAIQMATVKGEYGESGIDFLQSMLNESIPKPSRLSLFQGKQPTSPAPLSAIAGSRQSLPPDAPLSEVRRVKGKSGYEAALKEREYQRGIQRDKEASDFREVQKQKMKFDMEQSERKALEERKDKDRRFTSSLATAIDKGQRVIQKANEALDILDEDSWMNPATGFGSGIGEKFRGTAASNLAAKIDTMEALFSFEELKAMKEASKTGGALGQIAVRELELLAATIASLKQTQDEDQLRAHLNEVIGRFNRISDINRRILAGEVEPSQKDLMLIDSDLNQGSPSGNQGGGNQDGMVTVTNGQETLRIPMSDLPDAQAEGFRRVQ